MFRGPEGMLRKLKNKFNLTDIELFKQDISTYKVAFVANKLKQTESTHSEGQAIRLLTNKKLGFAANYGTVNYEETIQKALLTTNFSDDVNFAFPNIITSVKEIKNTSPVDFKHFIDNCKLQGEEIINTILNNVKTKNKDSILVDISFDVTSLNEQVENSNDLHYIHSDNIYSFLINIRETLENDFFEIFTAVVDNKIQDPIAYAKELIQHYNHSKKQAKIKSGSYPILFTSKAAKDFLEIIELALNGKQVNQKSSPWHDKQGKKVLSKLLTIKQDPTYGYTARSIDNEGSQIKPLVLINNGVLENFYFDLQSASKSSSEAVYAGNGFKPSLTAHVEPSLLNMVTSNGMRSLDEIIKDIDYGLLVDQTMGGLSTNIDGNMSVNVDVGFLIEKGEIVGRVKDTMVNGNIYTALNNIVELSNASKQYWSNTYNPDMLIEGLNITS